MNETHLSINSFTSNNGLITIFQVLSNNNSLIHSSISLKQSLFVYVEFPLNSLTCSLSSMESICFIIFNWVHFTKHLWLSLINCNHQWIYNQVLSYCYPLPCTILWSVKNSKLFLTIVKTWLRMREIEVQSSKWNFINYVMNYNNNSTSETLHYNIHQRTLKWNQLLL
jgi:hypothetical protein